MPTSGGAFRSASAPRSNGAWHIVRSQVAERHAKRESTQAKWLVQKIRTCEDYEEQCRWRRRLVECRLHILIQTRKIRKLTNLNKGGVWRKPGALSDPRLFKTVDGHIVEEGGEKSRMFQDYFAQKWQIGDHL